MPADPMRPARSRLDNDWLDRDAGPVVRPYAMTQGRVAPPGGAIHMMAWVRGTPAGGEIEMMAFVGATSAEIEPAGRLQPEHHAIVAAAWEPIPVVELAS